MPYRNPIIPGFNPDPSICRNGPDFFLATSTFEYFPGVPIYHSRDLVQWTLIGHALNRPSQLCLPVNKAGVGINAPTLRYHQGRWYMTTACNYTRLKSNPNDSPPQARGFHVWTDDIFDETKWSDPIYFDVTGIDQDLFFDRDGSVWYSWRKPVPGYVGEPGWYNSGVYTVQVDLDTGRSVGTATLMRQNFETGNRCCEGPHIYQRGRYWYLSTADGGTEIDHQQHISRSVHGPAGPYEPGPLDINPMLHNGDDSTVQQTGHMDMIEGPDGRWWAVFLAVRPQNGIASQLGRETFLLPVEWVDEWPVVNRRGRAGINGPAHVDLPRSSEHESWSYTYRPETNLATQGWYQPRTPLKRDFDVTSDPGALIIRGGPYTLADDAAVSMLLRKQTCFTGRWTASLRFRPSRAGEEAGVAVWWSKWCYTSMGIRGGPKQAHVVFRRSDTATEEPVTIETVTDYLTAETTVTFSIEAERNEYRFYWRTASGTDQYIGSIPSRILVRERAFDSPFIGTFFGLYSCGTEGIATSTDAVFSDITWRGIHGIACRVGAVRVFDATPTVPVVHVLRSTSSL